MGFLYGLKISDEIEYRFRSAAAVSHPCLQAGAGFIG